MRIQFALILIFGFLVSASWLRGGEPAIKDKELLLGKWILLEDIFEGKKSTHDGKEPLEFTITLAGDQMKMTLPPNEKGKREFFIQINAGKSPKEIDLIPVKDSMKTEKALGIYKVEKDILIEWH